MDHSLTSGDAERSPLLEPRRLQGLTARGALGEVLEAGTACSRAKDAWMPAVMTSHLARLATSSAVFRSVQQP